MSEQLKVSAICSVLALAAFAVVGPASVPSDSSENGEFSMIGQSGASQTDGQEDSSLPDLSMPQLPSLD